MSGSRRKTTEAPPPDEDLLSDSPFEGDLAAELAAVPRPRRKVPSVTASLAAGLLIVAGFLGGVQADKHWGANRPPDASDILSRLGRGGAGNFGGGNLGGGNSGGGGLGGQRGGGQGGAGTSASGNATTGTVKLVDGDIIYVQTADGVVRVKTTGSTKVTVAKKARLKDIKAGSPVVVQGTAGQDGSVTATSVGSGR